MSRIFWDTNLFIYLFEDEAERGARVASLRSKMLARGDDLVTSTLTIGEILVKPVRHGRPDLARQYEQRIAQAARIVSFDLAAARTYAEIRATGSPKGPDALQLACAAASGVELFITNDERLSGQVVRGIDFIVSLARAPL